MPPWRNHTVQSVVGLSRGGLVRGGAQATVLQSALTVAAPYLLPASDQRWAACEEWCRPQSRLAFMLAGRSASTLTTPNAITANASTTSKAERPPRAAWAPARRCPEPASSSPAWHRSGLCSKEPWTPPFAGMATSRMAVRRHPIYTPFYRTSTSRICAIQIAGDANAGARAPEVPRRTATGAAMRSVLPGRLAPGSGSRRGQRAVEPPGALSGRLAAALPPVYTVPSATPSGPAA